MIRFYLRVRKNIDDEWRIAFDCDPVDLDDLWCLADHYLRLGYCYAVDILKPDINREQYD